MQNIFVIDMGSNSIRLMQAELCKGQLCNVQKQLITARLGQKLPGSTEFTPQAIERGVQAVCTLAERARKIDAAAPIYAFATSAVRDAGNRGALLQRIAEEAGLQVEVLSGAEEAEVGAMGALGHGDGTMLDIGGGSTEVVIRQEGILQYTHSFDIGCVRARTQFPQEQDPEIYKWARAQFEAVDRPVIQPVIAIGGTPTTLAAAVLGLREYDPEQVQGTMLTRAQLSALYAVLKEYTPEQRAERWCMDARRAQLALYGISILTAFLDACGIDCIQVSEADNLEGYLYKKFPELQK